MTSTRIGGSPEAARRHHHLPDASRRLPADCATLAHGDAIRQCHDQATQYRHSGLTPTRILGSPSTCFRICERRQRAKTAPPLPRRPPKDAAVLEDPSAGRSHAARPRIARRSIATQFDVRCDGSTRLRHSTEDSRLCGDLIANLQAAVVATASTSFCGARDRSGRGARRFHDARPRVARPSLAVTQSPRRVHEARHAASTTPAGGFRDARARFSPAAHDASRRSLPRTCPCAFDMTFHTGVRARTAPRRDTDHSLAPANTMTSPRFPGQAGEARATPLVPRATLPASARATATCRALVALVHAPHDVRRPRGRSRPRRL